MIPGPWLIATAAALFEDRLSPVLSNDITEGNWPAHKNRSFSYSSVFLLGIFGNGCIGVESTLNQVAFPPFITFENGANHI